MKTVDQQEVRLGMREEWYDDNCLPVSSPWKLRNECALTNARPRLVPPTHPELHNFLPFLILVLLNATYTVGILPLMAKKPAKQKKPPNLKPACKMSNRFVFEVFVC